MKTKFTKSTDGSVTMEYDNNFGERMVDVFFCNGRYVFEYRNSGNHKQICKHLNYAGSTLMCADERNLLSLIRREYRAKKSQQRRDDIRARSF